MSHSQGPLPPPDLPSPTRQAIYFLTGNLAGLSTIPITYAFSRTSTPAISRPILQAGIRFWVFDITRSSLPTNLSVPLKGGISGAAGGFSEILFYSLAAHRKVPAASALALHSSKLFLCFGTFTGLSSATTQGTGLSVPKPFWWCWTLGAVSGALGTGTMEVLESRGKIGARDLMARTGKGAVLVGTVIGVQVSSSAAWLARGSSS